MSVTKPVKIVECPRDAMQGWHKVITTEEKIAYLNLLLKVGFDVIDFGSFVSPKAIPQMADTKSVVPHLEMSNPMSKLLAIIANERGATEALEFEEISELGFPFSISEEFQRRNANSTRIESLKRVESISELCMKANRTLVVYISMAFGNPYGDEYHAEIVLDWVDKITQLGVRVISLADTTGMSVPAQITPLAKAMVSNYPSIEFGLHLHSKHSDWQSKLEAGLRGGITRFDGALKGFGGCPMAQDELVGNLDTALIVDYLKNNGQAQSIDLPALAQASQKADAIFS